MFYSNVMNTFAKLQLQGEHAAYEEDDLPPPPTPPACPKADKTAGMEHHIYQAVAAGGQRVPILKTLLDSVCKNNCNTTLATGCPTGRTISQYTFLLDKPQ
jgi:hypothetical protein